MAAGSSGVVLRVNGVEGWTPAAPSTPLLHVLRNDFDLNGPKYGCGLGECGACLVLVDGKAARSCTLPAGAMAGHTITTLEGLGGDGGLHPVQRAFIDEQGAQCGYCLNGMIIRTVALLTVNPRPTDAEIRDALRFNLCRCGTHVEILASVRRAVALSGAAGAP